MFPLISTHDLLQLASGEVLALQVYKFVGNQPGKKVYIQSNLHGAEIVGNAVIHQLITFFSSLDSNEIRGEIWLVPVCNPLGTNQRSHFFATGRFNSYDGKNWNRIFWDYEKECEDLAEFAYSQIDNEPAVIQHNFRTKINAAWQTELAKLQQPQSGTISEQYRAKLQSLALDADYVIDLHSSSNQGIDFLFCFATREQSAKYFLLEYGILMTEYDGDAFDEAFLKPWLALETELEKLGKKIVFDLESWTLELGSGMTMNPESVARGVKGIKNYLAYKKVLSNEALVEREYIKLVEKDAIQSYYASRGGMIQNRLPLKTRVNKGDRLYQILSFNKKNQLPELIDIYAETAGLVFDLATNQCVNQGEYVLDILVR
ncbi:MAG TPA: succinylglutamate desuccinylase/aspartoacylase family protein [Xenococcaceae cyanobacterium]